MRTSHHHHHHNVEASAGVRRMPEKCFFVPACGRITRAGLVYSTANGHRDHRGSHLERPERVTGIPLSLQRAGILHKLDIVAADEQSLKYITDAHWGEEALKSVKSIPLPAKLFQLSNKDSRVHTKAQVKMIGNICKKLKVGETKGDDTYLTNNTEVHALTNIACCKVLMDRVLNGSLQCAFAAIRPPGHHAWSNKAHGFCIYNTVAALAKEAVNRGKRPLVLDVDFHMGDGTYDILKKEKNCFFLSVHRFGKNDRGEEVFPATGDETEIGEGSGKGNCLNIPLRLSEKKEGDAEYLFILISMILPIIRAWKPDIIILSNGFDCIAGDKIAEANGGMNLSPSFFGKLVRALRHEQPRIFAVLEGGYNPEAIDEGVCEVLRAMTESTCRYTPVVPISVQMSFRSQMEEIWSKWAQVILPSNRSRMVAPKKEVLKSISEKVPFFVREEAKTHLWNASRALSTLCSTYCDNKKDFETYPMESSGFTADYKSSGEVKKKKANCFSEASGFISSSTLEPCRKSKRALDGKENFLRKRMRLWG